MWLGEKLGEDAALSGATLSSQLPSPSRNSSTAMPESTCTATALDGLVESPLSVGGDRRTVHASSIGASSFPDKGGDPKTDHASFSAQMVDVVDEMAATCSPYRPGRLASQTAKIHDSPGLIPDVAVSSTLTLGSELRDELPSYQEDPAVRDEFPSFVQRPECRDGFPSSGVIGDYVHLEEGITNSMTDCADTAFLRVFRDDEKSEGLRQSDPRVQNLPASVSSSELSAHQMGGALAGEVRITKIEPSGMDAEGSDGCSLFGLTPVPFVSLLIAGSTGAVESAEDVPSEQREGSQKRSTVTSAFVDVVLSESLIISDTQRF